ncbi:MAG: group I intron-associated PD-(D/E)XK endonuclease [Ktedonobacteraceae bacterium]
MRDTSQKVLISHTAVLNRLVQLGYEVLLPWADHLGYDLAYYVTDEHRNFGFFVHRESHLVRIQVKTGWLSKDGTCLEFNTSTVSVRKRGNNKKSGYKGKAEYFIIYSPDKGKIYMVNVDEAVDGNMNLRFKSAGVMRSNGRQSWHVSYEEAVNSGVKYWWAEDYEL